MRLSCKNTSVARDRRVWCGVKGKFFVATLKNRKKSIKARKNPTMLSKKWNGQEVHRSLKLRQVRRKINEKSPSSVPVLNSNCEVILVEKRHGGSWVSHIPSRFKNCKYVCTATWMGLRWPMPSKCPWAPCNKQSTSFYIYWDASHTQTHTHPAAAGL